MIKRIVSLVLVAVLALSYANNSQAQLATANANMAAGSQWCYQQLTASKFIEPMVECFTRVSTDASGNVIYPTGIIPAVTLQFLSVLGADYMPMVAIMFMLVIAWFGFKIMTGDVQRLKAETMMMGLKMGAIIFFMINSAGIYTEFIFITQDFSEMISDAAANLHSGFCDTQVTGATIQLQRNDTHWQSGLWTRWDCIFQYILGLGGSLAIDGIVSFLLLMVFSMGTGILVFFAFMYVIVTLLCAAFRFIHIYLMAILALSFMFCIGYLFVPLLIFKNTFDYFKKWLTLVFGFIITPIVMFGFMGMMLVAMDVALFSGPYSVWCEIGGPTRCGAAHATGTHSGYDMFKDFTGNNIANTASANNNPHLEASFQQAFWVAFNGPQDIDPSHTTAGNPDCNQSNVGVMGYLCSSLKKGTSVSDGADFQDQVRDTMAQVGYSQPSLDLAYLSKEAFGSAKTCVKSYAQNTSGGSGGVTDPIGYYSDCKYAEDILISVAVAALITYIMMALLTYIPTLASNLTADLLSQDVLSSGGKMIKSQVLGEKEAMGALSAGKKGMMGEARSVAGMMATD